MPRSRVGDWTPKGIGRQCRLTRAQINALIEIAGGLPDPTSRDDVTKRLRGIGNRFVRSRAWQRQPTPSDLAKKFHAIENAADRLLKALSLPEGTDSDEIPPAILRPLERAADRYGQKIGSYPDLIPFEWDIEGETYVDYLGSEKLRTIVAGVRQLKAWAKDESRRARLTVKQKKARSRTRHSGDEAMQELIGDLIRLWIGNFMKPLGTSVGKPGTANRGKASGPLIRFVKAYLDALKLGIPKQAFRKDLELEKVLSPSEDAIRERIRNLGLVIVEPSEVTATRIDPDIKSRKNLI